MQVHQDQFRIPFLPPPDGCLTVIRTLYRKAHDSQQLHQPVPVLKLIVGDQDLGAFRSSTYAGDSMGGASLGAYSGVTPLYGNLEPKCRAPSRAAGYRRVAAHQPSVLTRDGQSQPGPLLGVQLKFGSTEWL